MQTFNVSENKLVIQRFRYQLLVSKMFVLSSKQYQVL